MENLHIIYYQLHTKYQKKKLTLSIAYLKQTHYYFDDTFPLFSIPYHISLFFSQQIPAHITKKENLSWYFKLVQL